MKRYLKRIAILLLAMILFQGCYSTKMYPKKTKAIVITTDGEKINYHRVYYKEDSILYGVQFSGSSVERNLSKLKIEKIKYLSVEGSVLIGLGAFVGVIFLIAVVDYAQNGIF